LYASYPISQEEENGKEKGGGRDVRHYRKVSDERTARVLSPRLARGKRDTHAPKEKKLVKRADHGSGRGRLGTGRQDGTSSETAAKREREAGSIKAREWSSITNLLGSVEPAGTGGEETRKGRALNGARR